MVLEIKRDTLIPEGTTICLDSAQVDIVLKTFYSEDFYHNYYDQIVPLLYKQIDLSNRIIGLDSAYKELQEARLSNDVALIAQAEYKYNQLLESKKTLRWTELKLKFWKVLAITEGVVIVILGTTVIILLYL